MQASEQKVVLVTGASSGIGAAVAKLYLNKGYRVALVARQIDAMKELVSSLSLPENSFLLIEADLKCPTECKKTINKCISEFGQLDVLISNAGLSMRANFNETKIEVLEELMEINYWATVHLSKEALPYLLVQNGSLVGVSSIGAYIAMPGRSAYCSSKAALHSFLEVLRLEHKQDGLHVLNVSPGFTQSNIRKNALLASGLPQNESPRDENKMMSPERVAEKIFKAVSSRKRDLIITKLGKFAILLRRFLPSFSDRYFIYFKKQEDLNNHK